MIIFAHRGMKNEMPENTIPAFKKAFVSGFGIEFDVRMTMDKKVVVIHDRNLQRITGKYVDVAEMSFAELRKLDVGSHFNSQFAGIGIPTLDEVCELITADLPVGQKAAVHLKYEEQTEEMLQSLSRSFKDYNLYQKAFIFDMTLENAKKLRKIDSKILIALSVGEAKCSLTVHAWEEVASDLDSFDYVWLDEWRSQGTILNKVLIDKIYTTGKEIYAISPELHEEHGHPQSENGYENVWKNLNKWGISGICTAYPDKLKATLISETLMVNND